MPHMPNLTQVDIEVLYDFYGERSPEIVRYALAAFRQEATLYVAEIEQFAQRSNWHGCRRRFHSLKTMTRMIGATGLSDLCAQLEQSDLASPTVQPQLLRLQQLWLQLQTEMDMVLYGTEIS